MKDSVAVTKTPQPLTRTESKGETDATEPPETVSKQTRKEDRVAAVESQSDRVSKEVPMGKLPDKGLELKERPITDLDQKGPPPEPTVSGEDDPDLDAAFQEAKERVFDPLKKRIPLVNELPLDVQKELGPMEINVHAYYEDQAKCFVFINIKSYRVGDRLADNGARLERITPDGVVIDYGEGYAKLLTGVKYQPDF